eukprot:5991067-Amphidinium_carterae.2
MQICFIVANVLSLLQKVLLGLPDNDDNKVTIHKGYKPYIEKLGEMEQPYEIKLDNSINSRYCRQHSSLATLKRSVNTPTFPNNFDNLHNHPNKNKNKTHIVSHTCLTAPGAQYVSSLKDNRHIIDTEHSRNNQ